MEALILSCSTGGGHNAAASALREELVNRGHHVDILDPYTLSGDGLDQKIGNTYIRLVQYAPHVFGVIYQMGNLYRRLPLHSPVYYANKGMVKPLKRYLDHHHYDVILMPHIFPGEITACMKDAGIALPPTICIATDYTCIPFTEETHADYYVIPSAWLAEEFQKRGIPKSRILPYGIPVSAAFRQQMSREEAIRRLKLSPERQYLLLSGGSIGAGQIRKSVTEIQKYLQKHPDTTLITICGSNRHLYRSLSHQYHGNPQMILLKKTDHMAEYMRASQAVITKPGGLSSTEAAVCGVPLIHISPIPGCETRNAAFFSKHGLSLHIGSQLNRLSPALDYLQKGSHADRMVQMQQTEINAHAAEDICDFVQTLAWEKGEAIKEKPDK